MKNFTKIFISISLFLLLTITNIHAMYDSADHDQSMDFALEDNAHQSDDGSIETEETNFLPSDFTYTFNGELFSIRFNQSTSTYSLQGIDGIQLTLTAPNGLRRNTLTYERGYFEFLNIPIMEGSYVLSALIPPNTFILRGNIRTALSQGINNIPIEILTPTNQRILRLSQREGTYILANGIPPYPHQFFELPAGEYTIRINMPPPVELF